MDEKPYIYTIQSPSMHKPISIIRNLSESDISNERSNYKCESLATLDLSQTFIDSNSNQNEAQYQYSSRSSPSKSNNFKSPISKQLQSIYKLSDYNPERISSHQPPRKPPPEPPIIHIQENKKKSPYLTGKDLQKRNILTNTPYIKSIEKKQQQETKSPSNMKIITKFEKKNLKRKDINEKNNSSISESDSDLELYSFSNNNNNISIPTPNCSPIRRRRTNEIESSSPSIIIPPTPFTLEPRYLSSNPKLVVVGGLIYEKSEYYSFPMTENVLTKEERALKYCVTPTKWNDYLLKKICENPKNNKPINTINDKIVVINGKEYKKYEYKTIPIVENHMRNDEKKLKYKIPPNDWNKMVNRKLNKLNLSDSRIGDLVSENDILYVDESEYNNGIITPINNSHFNESFSSYNDDKNSEDEYVEINGCMYNKKEYKTIDYVENNMKKEEKSLKYKIPPSDWNQLIRYKLNRVVVKGKEKDYNYNKLKELMEEENEEEEENENNKCFNTSISLTTNKTQISSPQSPLVTIHGIKYKKSLYKNNPLLENILSEEERNMKYKLSPSKWNKMLSNYIIKLENENEDEISNINNNNNDNNKKRIKQEIEPIPPWECVMVKGRRYAKKDYVDDENIERLLSPKDREKKYSVTPKEWRIFLTIKRSEIIKSIKRENNNNNGCVISSPLKNEIKIINNEEDDINYLSDGSFFFLFSLILIYF